MGQWLYGKRFWVQRIPWVKVSWVPLGWHHFYQTVGPVLVDFHITGGERFKINRHEFTTLFMLGSEAAFQSIQGKNFIHTQTSRKDCGFMIYNGGKAGKPITIIHCVRKKGKYFFAVLTAAVLTLLLKLWMSIVTPRLLTWIFFFFTERDGRCYLLLAAMLLCFTKRQATVHPPSLFSPSMSHCFSRLCTGRQLVQKQAPCPPPQTQR